MNLPLESVPGGLEVHWARVDGLRLRLGLAPPLANGRTLLLLTGRTEFLEKYEDVYGELRARGFRVASLDWRGQGGSDRLLADRRRGYVDDFAAYGRDLTGLSDFAEAHLPRPWFGLAHSMGALILLDALATRPTLVQRAVLAAPFLGLHASPLARQLAPSLAAAICGLGFSERYVPGHSDEPAAGDVAEGNVLTSDHDRFRLYRQRCRAHQDLLVGGVTWAWLRAALAAIGRLEEPGKLEAIATPLLLLRAGNERVVDAQAAARALARLPHAQVRDFVGAEHELLMERDETRLAVLEEIDAFLR